MTSTKHDHVRCTSGDQPDWSLFTLKGEAELENLDHQAGHQYVPMDLYVDPGTIEEHFQTASISWRWRKARRTAS